MYLPENLHRRHFSEWNYLVRGLVEVWDLFRLVGQEEELERQLAEDPDGRLVEMLGRIGNDCATLASLLSVRIRVGAGTIQLVAAGSPVELHRHGAGNGPDTNPLTQLEELLRRLDLGLPEEGAMEPARLTYAGGFGWVDSAPPLEVNPTWATAACGSD